MVVRSKLFPGLPEGQTDNSHRIFLVLNTGTQNFAESLMIFLQFPLESCTATVPIRYGTPKPLSFRGSGCTVPYRFGIDTISCFTKYVLMPY